MAKCAADKAESAENNPISPEEQLRLAMKYRLKNIPENMIAALEKEVKSEKTHYPDLHYSEKQIAAMKDAIIEKLDSILNQLA